MTVDELRNILSRVDGNLLVGAEDADGCVCEIQFAGITSDDLGRGQFFFIRANGGFYLFADYEPLDHSNEPQPFFPGDRVRTLPCDYLRPPGLTATVLRTSEGKQEGDLLVAVNIDKGTQASALLADHFVPLLEHRDIWVNAKHLEHIK